MRDDETDDSKLVWVVGVDRDEVGESTVKNCGIRVKSRVRSEALSWTKEVRKSSLRSKKVVGGDEDIKTIAGAEEGAGDSAMTYVGGQSLFSKIMGRACVSGGVIKRAGEKVKFELCSLILRRWIW